MPSNTPVLRLPAKDKERVVPLPGAFLEDPNTPATRPPATNVHEGKSDTENEDDNSYEYEARYGRLPKRDKYYKCPIDAQTPSLPHPALPLNPAYSPPVTYSFPTSKNMILGPAALPPPCSDKAPRFSGKPHDFPNFLTEYDTLATAHHLNEKQKSETILMYIPSRLRDLWRSRDGFGLATGWATYKAALSALYQDDNVEEKRYSRKHLQALFREAAMHRVNDSREVVELHRHFLTIT